MLSGSPEDMKYIRQAGQPDAWCRDSGGWLQKTFEKENGVSAVLHLNEKTLHIHATVVPIVRGERRKAKLERAKNTQNGKRTYRTKKDRPRLCTDDVMAREKLKELRQTLTVYCRFAGETGCPMRDQDHAGKARERTHRPETGSPTDRESLDACQ